MTIPVINTYSKSPAERKRDDAITITTTDPVQIRIRQEFQGRGVEYVHRRDSTRKPATALFADQVGQMLCAFGGDLQTAIRAKGDIFESDVMYNKIFPGSLSIAPIFAVQTLG